ncbi:hypothetical protein BC833DRAFT_623891 [Globomyces pollinis-pini]|nr:hypothetical protein BC833DRAFT_623891 [Globomyces pollinis-pini]
MQINDSHSYSVIQLQYRDSSQCQNSPSIMYLFNVYDITSSEPLENEIWPDYYYFTLQESPLGYCGSLSIQLVHSCCTSSLSLIESNNYWSGSANILPTNDYEYGLNAYAAGGTYCVLQESEKSTIYGYKAIYVLNDGHCYDTYKCHSDGTFQIYSGPNCEEISMTLELQSDLMEINDNEGLVAYGRYAKGADSKVNVSWITYCPSTIATPNTNIIWDRLQYVCFIVSIVGDLFVLIYSIRLFLRTKTYYTTLTIITSTLWLINTVLTAFYALYKFPDENSMYIFIECLWSIQNLASLCTVMQTSVYLFRVMRPPLKSRAKITMFAVTIAIHIVFAGSYYFGYCWSPDQEYCIHYDTYRVWMTMMPFWFLFVFSFDLIPSSYLVYSLLLVHGSKSVLQRLKYLYEVDKIFMIGMICNTLLCIGYFVTSHIQFQTDLLGSDKAYDSFSALLVALITLHSQISLLIMSRLKNVLFGIANNGEQHTVNNIHSTKN